MCRLAIAGTLLVLAGCSVASQVDNLFARDENTRLNQPAKVSEFVALGPGAVPSLIATLSSKQPRHRALAVAALGRFRAKQAMPQLLKLIDDGDADVRRRLGVALGEIGQASAVDTLLRMLHDRDASVRASAVWALGRLNARGSVDAVYAAFSAGPQVVRDTAVWTLRRLLSGAPRPASVPLALETALSSANESARIAALRLVDAIAETRLLTTVERLVADPDETLGVRRVGLSVLARHGDWPAQRLFAALALSNDAETRLAVYRALYLRPPTPLTLRLLMTGLGEQDEWRRDEVSEVLANHLGLTQVPRTPRAVFGKLLAQRIASWRERSTPEAKAELLLVAALEGKLTNQSALESALAQSRDRQWLFYATVAFQLTPSASLLATLIKQLATLPVAARRAVLPLLAASPQRAAYAQLLAAALADSDKRVVRDALETVPRVASLAPELWTAVLRCAGHADGGVRRRATRLLSRAKGKQLALLLALAKSALSSTDGTAKAATIAGVVALSADDAVETLLLTAITTDSTSAVAVFSAAKAFKRKKRLAEKALTSLRAKSPALREAALRFLQAATGQQHGADDITAWRSAIDALK